MEKELDQRKCSRLLLEKVLFLQKSLFGDKLPKGEVFIKFLNRYHNKNRYLVVIEKYSKFADVSCKDGKIEWI